jgi:RNA-directed DNA polymerase
METKLSLIAEIARKDKKCTFNNLVHMLSKENLLDCFYRLKRDAASGVDGVSMEEYEQNLDSNLTDLENRLKSMSYRPKPVRRVFIPKSNGKLRPLGIPAIEDKIVQQGIAQILSTIYEVDFLDFSYGFRPKRSCHDALNSLDKDIMKLPINYIIDADIKGFFDNVNQDWLIRCLKERIADERLIRYIIRFLKAGVMDGETLMESEVGTPQGGIISPILANIYLHYVLDLWFEKCLQPKCQGIIRMVRYADDFVIAVERKDETAYIMDELTKRLKKFGLELSMDKTQIIEFGKRAFYKWMRGGSRPKTFNFLGFTHYCEKTRRGYFKVGRKTDRKRFKSKLKEFDIWLRRICFLAPVKEWWSTLCDKLRGHFQYYGVSGNYRWLDRFHWLVTKLVFKRLNRRSQKKSYTWEQFRRFLEHNPLPKPKIYHNLYTLKRVRNGRIGEEPAAGNPHGGFCEGDGQLYFEFVF